MQQNSIEILSTRPLPDELLEEATNAGIHIDVLSFIETEPVQDVNVYLEIEQAYLRSATVVFTSMNAVEAVAAVQDGQQPDWTVYCTGNTTRQLISKYFGEERIAGTASSSADLADLIIGDETADEVIFFCGDQRRDELPEILRSNDIDVTEIVVYQTITVPHHVNKTYQGILFFSPSGVDSFFRYNQLKGNTILFAIGNTTAAEIKKHTRNSIIIADEPGKTELVRQMIEFFHE